VTLRLERILEELAAGVVVVNANYDILVINMAARRLLYIQTPAVGEDLIHRVPAAMREALRDAIDTALTGQATTVVLSLAPDPIEGDRGDLEITCSPVQIDASRGDVEFVRVEVVDVSAVARHNRELAAARDKALTDLAELQARSAAAIAEVRELRHANQRMAAEQGRLRAVIELMQVAQEEAQAAAEENETLNEEQQATNEELETVNEELQATIEELTTTNDELQARSTDLELLASTLDAQRRDGEVERTRLEAILATMSDAVLVINDTGGVLLRNAAYERLFGDTAEIRPEDETGQPLPDEMWPQRRALRGEAFTLSFTLPGADGSRRWFECNGQQVQRGDGNPWGVLVIRDITERSLRRQQEQFLAMAAHELRTPLTALSGRLQLLLRRLGNAQVDDRLRQDAAHALEQARRLETHIHELMDATRAQFGQLVVERVPVDLTTLVREAADIAQPLARGQRIEVTVPEQAVVIAGDPHRLEQVLLNLLTNAITHAPDTERIDIRLEHHLGEAVISVQDQGPGISEEDLPQIFTRFFQSRQRRPGHDGLGLGLFIAQEIVSAHGGTIEVTSTIGEGTTFAVRLPR
jgi:two-component system CheB/CheR fusion protein